jgi:hypothetical protein
MSLSLVVASWTILNSQETAASPVQVLNLDLEYLKLDEQNRDPYRPEETGNWGHQVALVWDLGITKWAYWNNRVHTETLHNSASVHTVGWQWEIGLRPFSFLDLMWMHHSRHVMEREPERRFDTQNQFPVTDGYGIRIHLLGDR